MVRAEAISKKAKVSIVHGIDFFRIVEENSPSIQKWIRKMKELKEILSGEWRSDTQPPRRNWTISFKSPRNYNSFSANSSGVSNYMFFFWTSVVEKQPCALLNFVFMRFCRFAFITHVTTMLYLCLCMCVSLCPMVSAEKPLKVESSNLTKCIYAQWPSICTIFHFDL